ncbi:MAG: nuclease [Luteitalea sp.]|nr:nuclease [Luteitalea sp.]
MIIELVSASAGREREWMAQWRRAGVALARVRADDLAHLPAADALAATDALLAIGATVPLSVERLTWSGLIELQVYGGGGNSGATLRNDYVELYNRGPEAVSVSGWSVQYLPASGNGTWQTTALRGAIGPGQYYLVQQAQGGGGTASLPAPDAIGTIAISGTAGHVALVDSQSALPAGTCEGLSGVVDFVGFGGAVCREGAAAAPAASNTSALICAQSGCIDTDDKGADFFAGSPQPRNGQVLYTCGSTETLTLSISEIQGAGVTSPVVNRRVRTSGVVTGLKTNGFFIQTPDAGADADPATSEGLFVFTSVPPGRLARESVEVTGIVQEFVPASDPAAPPLTEIVSPTVALVSSGAPLPAPIVVTASDTQPAGGGSQLEKYEGMRVSIDSLTVIAPTSGTTIEAAATGTTNGVFYGVITGLERPRREPGVDVSSRLPPGAPVTIPRFDGNPERLRVDTDGQPGATPIDVTTGTVVTGLIGPLDYGFRTYTLLPDVATPPAIAGGMVAAPVSIPASDEFTIASFNLQRFFDTVNDAETSDAVLTPAAFANRLNKASLAIRGIMRLPDVIGVEEMENLATLQALASKVSADAVAAGQADPAYHAILEEGNDIGGIDVGFLVRSDRVTIHDYQQPGKDTQYMDPNTGELDLLNDRPPLLLRATVRLPAAVPSPITVIVNHLRSLSGIEDPADGSRIRVKRRAQAEFVASLVQNLQQADADRAIVLVGDFNAFHVNDGYVDVIGTILGSPAPADQVVLASDDLVEPNLWNVVATAPRHQQYSYVFDGNAQELDHVIVNTVAASAFDRLEYGRANADFPESYRSDPNRPERISDHDMSVAYFKASLKQATVMAVPALTTTAAARPTTLTATLTNARTGEPVAGAPVAFDMNGETHPGTTGLDGVATTAVTFGSPGSFTLRVTFEGTDTLLPSSGTAR